jgi:hypothetical protein
VGSKLGLILSLFFSVFVFIFACDLITLQSNFSNLESIANSVSLMISEGGAANFLKIKSYLNRFPDVSIEYDNPVFEVGEYKEFTLSKEYRGFLIFAETMDIKVSRTVLVGQFERTY